MSRGYEEGSAILRMVAMTVAAIFAGSGVAWACPVCFGASASPMAKGMNSGIFVLLGVTATLLAAIAVVGWRIAKRAGSQAAVQEPVAARGEG